MSKHTPGPWAAKSAREGTYEIVAVTDKYDKEGKNITFTVAAFVRKADARLITAAPDAVESLRALVEHCEDYAIYLKTLGPEFREDYLNLKNEINKAAGILRDIDDTE